MDRTMDATLENWLSSIVTALNKQDAEPRTFEFLFLSEATPEVARPPTPLGVEAEWIPSLTDNGPGKVAWDLRDPSGAPLAVVACSRREGRPRWSFSIPR